MDKSIYHVRQITSISMNSRFHTFIPGFQSASYRMRWSRSGGKWGREKQFHPLINVCRWGLRGKVGFSLWTYDRKYRKSFSEWSGELWQAEQKVQGKVIENTVMQLVRCTGILNVTELPWKEFYRNWPFEEQTKRMKNTYKVGQYLNQFWQQLRHVRLKDRNLE